MKTLVLMAVTFLFLSCKNKEARTYEFVENFNSMKDSISDTTIISKKAFYVGKDGLNLDYILKVSPDALPDKELFFKVEGDLESVIKKFPDVRKLINEKVNVNIRVYDKYGSKITEKKLQN